MFKFNLEAACTRNVNRNSEGGLLFVQTHRRPLQRDECFLVAAFLQRHTSRSKVLATGNRFNAFTVGVLPVALIWRESLNLKSISEILIRIHSVARAIPPGVLALRLATSGTQSIGFRQIETYRIGSFHRQVPTRTHLDDGTRALKPRSESHHNPDG